MKPMIGFAIFLATFLSHGASAQWTCDPATQNNCELPRNYVTESNKLAFSADSRAWITSALDPKDEREIKVWNLYEIVHETTFGSVSYEQTNLHCSPDIQKRVEARRPSYFLIWIPNGAEYTTIFPCRELQAKGIEVVQQQSTPWIRMSR